MNFKEGLSLATLLLLCACGRPAGEQAAGQRPTAAEARIAPPIIATEEAADPALPPSYEVAIASAAADHNKALERCRAQPEAVRAQCEEEANAAFSESEGKLQDLRGNQE
jgi:hypothetical protein